MGNIFLKYCKKENYKMRLKNVLYASLLYTLAIVTTYGVSEVYIQEGPGVHMRGAQEYKHVKDRKSVV